MRGDVAVPLSSHAVAGPDRRSVRSEANRCRGRAIRRHARQVLDATNNPRAVHPTLHQGRLRCVERADDAYPEDPIRALVAQASNETGSWVYIYDAENSVIFASDEIKVTYGQRATAARGADHHVV